MRFNVVLGQWLFGDIYIKEKHVYRRSRVTYAGYGTDSCKLFNQCYIYIYIFGKDMSAYAVRTKYIPSIILLEFS